MNLSQLYYYRTLIRTGNYKEAANQLFISQPTLSVSISNLEKELGTTLIARKRNTIKLTEEGEEFGQAVIQALQILDESAESLKKRGLERNSNIHLGIVFSAQSQVWSNIMRDFWADSREKPKFTIEQDTTPKLLQKLKNGEVDAIIAGTMGEDDSLERIPLWYQNVVAITDSSCPLAIQKADSGIYLSDLRGYHVISYNLDGPLGLELNNLIAGQEFDVDCSYSDEITLCSLVSVRPNTVALACKSWLIDSFKDVTVLPIHDAPADFHRFYLTYRSSTPKNAVLLHRFIDFVSAYDFESMR